MNVAQIPRRFVTDAWGGTETVILETSRRLLARGHATSIVTSAALSSPGADTIGGVTTHRFPYFYPYAGLSRDARHKLDQKAGNLFSFSLTRHLATMPGLDLLHAHTAKRLGGIVRTVARHRRIPYIVSLHGGLLDVPAAESATWTEPTRGTWEWGRLLGAAVGSRRVMDDAAAIVCLGDQELAHVKARYPRTRVCQLPNGVDTARFKSGDGRSFRLAHAIPDTRTVLLTIGRIDPQKNQILAVEALAALADRGHDLHLVLIGAVTSNDYAAQLRERIDTLRLGDRVTLVAGLAPGAPALVDAYHAADLFLLPSIHEPFGIVVLEAWAAGLPVIASRAGGLSSLVEHEKTGLLLADLEIGTLVSDIERLLRSRPERDRLAGAGRRRADAYDWERVTDQLVDLYTEVRDAHPVR